MSTYTDLHNKIKETIVVNYNDRKTEQIVKFLNENNEYWGKFNGKIESLSGTILSDSIFNNGIINNAVLSNCIIGNLNLDEIGLEVENLSNDLEKIQNNLSGGSSRIDNLSIEIWKNGTFRENNYKEGINLIIPESDSKCNTKKVSIDCSNWISAGHIINAEISSEADTTFHERPSDKLIITFLDIDGKTKTQINTDITKYLQRYTAGNGINVNYRENENNFSISLNNEQAISALGIDNLSDKIENNKNDFDSQLNNIKNDLKDNYLNLTNPAPITGDVLIAGDIKAVGVQQGGKQHSILFKNGDFENLSAKNLKTEKIKILQNIKLEHIQTDKTINIFNVIDSYNNLIDSLKKIFEFDLN